MELRNLITLEIIKNEHVPSKNFYNPEKGEHYIIELK